MKKVVKWTIYTAALLIIGALTICYFVIPNQTKEIIAKIVEYANTPIGIAGTSITIGGLISFVLVKYILANTKFGKKELDTIKNNFEEHKEKVEGICNDVKSVTTNYINEFQLLKTDCDNKISIVYQEFEDLQSSLISSLKTIPNKKVQAVVAEYEAKLEIRKQEIINKTINANTYVEDKIAEIKSQYDSMYKELVDKVEVILNEKGKETTND